MNNYMNKIILSSFFLIFICTYAYAEYGEAEGYDENTEIRIKGVVTEILPQMRGAIIVIIKAGNREYRVVTGPKKYLLLENIEFKPKDSLLVTGSKFIGRDGCIYIIARRIKNVSSGRNLLLRDSALIPLWREGSHRMRQRDKNPHYRDPHMMRDRD
jgi:hypothetical protein